MVFRSFSDKPISKLPTPTMEASLVEDRAGRLKNLRKTSLLFTPKASIRFLDVHPQKICGFQRFWNFLIPIYHPLMWGLKSYYILYIDTNTIANHCHELKHVLFVSVCSRRSPETVRSRSHDPTFSATWSLANTAWPGEDAPVWKPPQKKAGPYRPYCIGKSMWHQWAHKLGVFKIVFLVLKNCCILSPIAGPINFEGHLIFRPHVHVHICTTKCMMCCQTTPASNFRGVLPRVGDLLDGHLLQRKLNLQLLRDGPRRSTNDHGNDGQMMGQPSCCTNMYKSSCLTMPYLTFCTFLDPFLHLGWGSVTTLIPPDQSTLQMNDETTQTGPSWPIVDPSPPSSCPVSSRNAATAP